MRLQREARVWRRASIDDLRPDPFDRVFVWALAGLLPILVALFLTACSPTARVVDRIVTVPVKERCAPRPPLLSPVLGARCGAGQCCRPKEEESKLVENVELILRWMAEVEALCAPTKEP